MQSNLNNESNNSPSGDLGVHLSNPIFKVLAEIAKQSQTEAYVIGGFVRDLFLQRPSKDIDIVILGNGIAFAEKVGEQLKTKVAVFKNFGTAMLKFKDLEIEFVGARKESYQSDSRNPIVENGKVAGVIYTETNTPIPNTNVLLIGDNGFSVSTVSDAQGNYSFSGLSTGKNYILDFIVH